MVKGGEEPLRLVHVLTVYKTSLNGTNLLRPEGVTCRGNAIIVADTGHGQLVRYTLDKEELSAGQEIALPKDSHPVQVQVNSKGEIFFLDNKLRRVVKLEPDGKPVGKVEPEGTPNMESMFIRAFALDSADNIYMLDLFGERLIIADANMRYVREIPLPQGGKGFSDVTVDKRGKIYLLDCVTADIYTAAADKKEFSLLTDGLKQYATFPTSLTPDGQGGLLVVDCHGSGIVIVGPDGTYRGRQLTMGWKPGLLYYPTQLCLTANDEAVIADQANSRVQIFKVVR